MKYSEEIPHLVQYLKGNLSPDEKNALEQSLSNMEDLRDELNFIKLLRRGIELAEDKKMLQQHYEKIKWRRRLFYCALSILPLLLFFILLAFKSSDHFNHQATLKTTIIANKNLHLNTSEKTNPALPKNGINKEITKVNPVLPDKPTTNKKSTRLFIQPNKNIVKTDSLGIKSTTPTTRLKSLPVSPDTSTTDKNNLEKKDTSHLLKKRTVPPANPRYTVTVIPSTQSDSSDKILLEDDLCYRKMEIELKKYLIKNADTQVVDYAAFAEKRTNGNNSNIPLNDIYSKINKSAAVPDIFIFIKLENRQITNTDRQKKNYTLSISLNACDTQSGVTIAATILESGRSYLNECQYLISRAFLNRNAAGKLKIEDFFKTIEMNRN